MTGKATVVFDHYAAADVHIVVQPNCRQLRRSSNSPDGLFRTGP